MIIGITGTNGAGKGTIAEFLKQKGFKHYSVRDFLIEQIQERGLPVNRDSMVIVANQIREINSSSYIIEKLFEMAKKQGGNSVIESVRTEGEAKAIKLSGGYLIAIDAIPSIRYVRITTRKNETDNISYEKFLEDENREMMSEDTNKQNISKCIELADFLATNNSDFASLFKQVENIYNKILEIEKLKTIPARPSWDEYFIKIMEAVSLRATCNRGRSGCVIVKNNHVLSTGYVGSPPGLPHCDEVGHLMIKASAEGEPEGELHEHCVRTIHAEQNAIVNAAKFGIELDGATLYCQMEPCSVCARMIIAAGIKRVVCKNKYHKADLTREMFKQTNVELVVLNNNIQEYEK